MIPCPAVYPADCGDIFPSGTVHSGRTIRILSFWPLHPYPEFLPPQNPLPPVWLCRNPVYSIWVPCLAIAPRLLEVISLQSPHSFPLKGGGPVIRLTKYLYFTAAPQVPTNRDTLPAPVAPLVPSFLPGPRPNPVLPGVLIGSQKRGAHQHMVLRSMHIDIGRQDDFSS